MRALWTLVDGHLRRYNQGSGFVWDQPVLTLKIYKLQQHKALDEALKTWRDISQVCSKHNDVELPT